MVSRVLAALFAWTWPFWPFVFVFNLVSAIKQINQPTDDSEKNPAFWPCIWASVSLAVIVGGMLSLLFLAA